MEGLPNFLGQTGEGLLLQGAEDLWRDRGWQAWYRREQKAIVLQKYLSSPSSFS